VTRGRLFAGIDVGSLSAEAVLLTPRGFVAGYAIGATGASARRAAQEVLAAALAAARAPAHRIADMVSTGYGREAAAGGRRVTEITCHARAAWHLFPGARTVVDIGGQDSKVIRLDAAGGVADFAMNDRCAAGTGRFLEVMARALEMDLEEMGPRSLRHRKVLRVSSLCTVFAESEVVSLIARGETPEDIAWGIHRAVADRVASLAERVGIVPPVVMTGGVAMNPGARRALEERLGARLLVPPEPQIAGALGAALIALEEATGRRVFPRPAGTASPPKAAGGARPFRQSRRCAS